MRVNPSKRSTRASMLALTLDTIAPTLRHAILINSVTAFFEPRVANHAT